MALAYLAAFWSLGSQATGLIGERGTLVLCLPLLEDADLPRPAALPGPTHATARLADVVRGAQRRAPAPPGTTIIAGPA